nr:putative LAGLIDADG homing endonuclease [Schizostauron trachyderma]UDP55621.1 putative LAGLIDADG homing endonuclease [Schizostauron trachyderma]
MDLNAQWIVGFVDGEGCFHIGINRNQEMKLGIQVLPEFTVVQHQVDEQVLYALKAYFGCGVVRKNHGTRLCYRVRGHENLRSKIIPFFEKHQLKTRKRIDFAKFRKVVLLMEKKEHLSQDGLEKIRQIKQTMNSTTFLR